MPGTVSLGLPVRQTSFPLISMSTTFAEWFRGIPTMAVVVDGEVKSVGKIPKKEEVAGWIQ